MMKHELPRFLRPRQIVELSGISKSRVFAAIYSGHLKAVRMGRAILIPVDSYREWVSRAVPVSERRSAGGER